MDEITAPPELAPGTAVGGFQVVSLLGRGGMGEVYLARDTLLGRKVALKFLLAGRVASPALNRILDEARTTARLNHPHIVTVYSVGEHEGRPFVALEYIPGPTLRQRLTSDRPGYVGALRVGLAVAEALGEAHAHGVLHRDLKPENVILPDDGRLRVVDFGLAKVVEPDVSASLSVERVGTPRYMAPEQWLMGAITAATDVWALGAILHELLAGRHPFASTKIEELGRSVTLGLREPLVAPDLPAGLTELVERCLDVNPERRPAALEVAAAVHRLLAAFGHRDDGESPFPGLRPFGEKHARFFFGRDAEVGELLERIGEQAVLPIVGPSGGGKSSFVHAGVVPRLHEQASWVVLALRPGDQPFLQLARAIRAADPSLSGGSPRDSTAPMVTPSARPPSTIAADPGELAAQLAATPGALALALGHLATSRAARVFLFVDQLEELFTVVSDEDTRDRFLDALVGAAGDAAAPVRFCFTIRDDFFGHLGKARHVRQAIGRVTLVRSPGPAELREMLQKPLAAVGHRYDDPALVDEMVAAVGNEPGGLPLLQFTARALWDRRDAERRLLLRSAYEAMGGVEGALAEHADGVMAGLDSHETRLARDLLLRLVTPEGTSRPLRRAALLDGLDARAERVFGVLVDARLLRVGRARDDADAQVELAHDSLIRGWQRLARWIEDGREELAVLSEIKQAAELWERRGRRSDEVWRGEALRESERTLARLGVELPEGAARFLEASRRQERGRRRRLRALQALGVVALATITAGALIVAASFARQRRAAEHQRALAEVERAEAQRGGARLAFTTGDPLTARAQLRASLETRDSPQARAVWWELAHEPLAWRRTIGAPVWKMGFSPDGALVGIANPRGGVELIDARTAELRSLGGFADRPLSLDFSPARRQLAAALGSGEIVLVDVDSDARRSFMAHPSRGPVYAAFGPEGKTLATANLKGEVRVWDLGSEIVGRTLAPQGVPINTMAFSHDGKRVAVAGGGNTIRVFDVDSGAVTQIATQHSGSIHALAFSPDGALASAGSDRLVRIHQGSVEVRTFAAEGVTDLAFSPDGRRFATTGSDGGARVWDAATGELTHEFSGGDDRVSWLAFSPDSRRLATGGTFQPVMLRDLDARPRRRPRHHTGELNSVVFSPDGQWVVTAGLDREVRLWDVRTGQVVMSLAGATSTVALVQITGDDKVIATDQTAIRVWDVKAGGPPRVIEGAARSLALSGDALVAGGADGSVRFVRLSDGQELRRLKLHQAPVVGLEVSDDGRHLITVVDGDPTIHVWNAASGAPERDLAGHSTVPQAVALSRDGRFLASCDNSGEVRLWTVATGEGRVALDVGRRTFACDLSQDGSRIAASDNLGGVHLLDVTSGATLSFGGHGAAAGIGKAVPPVAHLALSPDGTLLATVSPKSAVRLWRADSGRPVWRTVALLGWTGELVSGRGWSRVDGQPVAGDDAAWRRALSETAALAAFSSDHHTMCLATLDDRVEGWDLVAGRRRFSQPFPAAGKPLIEIVALGDGCLVLSGGIARRFDAAGSYSDLGESLALIGEGGLLLGGQTLRAVDGRGSATVDAAAPTALAPIPGGAVIGDVTGAILRVPLTGEPPMRFRSIRALPITRLLATPDGLLVAGSDDGDVDLYDLASGTWLAAVGRIHGSVRHLALQDGHLLAASDLGDALIEDLTVFGLERCELLRAVWKAVPVVLENDVIVARPPPRDHPCLR